MCCPAQLAGSLVTICLPKLRPAGVRFALLLQALPFCCGLHPVAMGYTLRRSLSVVPGCLGNGRLRQPWACTSVGVDCLGNGRRPSPTELHFMKTSSPVVFGIAVLFVALRYPNSVFLGFPGLAHCPSPVQSQVQPSQVSVCRFNRAPIIVRFCMERCGAPLRSGVAWSRTGCQLHQPRPLPGVPRLFYTWEFPCSVGNKDPSGNAALTHPLRIHRELESWVVLTVPS